MADFQLSYTGEQINSKLEQIADHENRIKDLEDNKSNIQGVAGQTTPSFKIEGANLKVSYDNGTSWTDLGKVVGADGQNGTKGDTGGKGEDGLTPHIGTNGNWWIGTTDTGVQAAGKDGEDGKTPEFKLEDGQLWVSYNNGGNWRSLGGITAGEGGQSIPGPAGTGISNITIDTNGNLIITLTDGSTVKPGNVKYVLTEEDKAEIAALVFENIPKYDGDIDVEITPIVNTFTLSGFSGLSSMENNTFEFDSGMTWGEWKQSEYNHFIANDYSMRFDSHINNVDYSVAVGAYIDTPLEGITYSDGTPVQDGDNINATTYYFRSLDNYKPESSNT